MSAVNYSQFHGSKRCPACGWQSLAPTAPGERWHCLVCKAEHTMPDELTRLQPAYQCMTGATLSHLPLPTETLEDPKEAAFWQSHRCPHCGLDTFVLDKRLLVWRCERCKLELSQEAVRAGYAGAVSKPAPSEPRHVLAAVCNTCDRTPETTALATCHYCHQHVCADCLVVVREGDEFRDSCPKCQRRKVMVQTKTLHMRGELVTAAVVVSIVTVSLFGASLLMTFPFWGGVWVAGMLLLIAAVLIRSFR